MMFLFSKADKKSKAREILHREHLDQQIFLLRNRLVQNATDCAELVGVCKRTSTQQLTCSGTMIEPSAMSRSPETVILTLGPAQKLTLDLGQGAVNARKVSDNKIQLKFRTRDFEGEYFHYTGDLFLIYKSGHLMKLMCVKRES
jgi:hypothetical protein